MAATGDATKRGPMGEVAAERADVVVVTADNSPWGADLGHHRCRDARLRTGPSPSGDDPRGRAGPPGRPIALALAEGRPGDVVLVAGKGHEATQDIDGVVTPFDDRAVVAEEWARMGGAS